MKKSYAVILTLSFILSCLFAYNGAFKAYKAVNYTSFSSRKTVVIDAGHGGKDVGTSGIDGTFEKAVNLDIALILYDYLSVCGIKSVLVRAGDYEIYPEGSERNKSDLYNRLDFVNSVPNSILISIHQNHYSDEKEWGTQIWYSGNTNESKTYADLILNNIKTLLQPENKRQNKQSDDSYYLLYKAKVPSIMVECGFMSNREENEKLKTPEYQKKLAYAILTGICGEV